MLLKEKINKDFMEAFKNKEMDKKNFLGLLKGEIQNEISRSGKDDDGTVLGIVKKMEKSLKQTNTEESLIELSYLEPYLPQLMGEEEITTIVEKLISEGNDNIGSIMKVFNIEHSGKADNKLVSQVIKRLL